MLAEEAEFDAVTANRFAPSVGVTVDVAVVGEGVGGVDGTAILKSILRLATFSRLSEPVLNPLFSLASFCGAALVVLLKSGTNEKLHAGDLRFIIVYW